MHLHGYHGESLPQPSVPATTTPGTGYILKGAGGKFRADTTVCMKTSGEKVTVAEWTEGGGKAGGWREKLRIIESIWKGWEGKAQKT